MVFLVLLGVTFYIGVRSAQRVSPKEPRQNERRSFRKPTELSVPVWTKKMAYPAIMPEATSTSPQTMPHLTVSTFGAQAREPSERGAAGRDTSAETAEVARNLHDVGGFGVSGEGEVEDEAEQVCSISQFHIERNIGASTRSFRRIWKDGPGNNTNPEQVKDRVSARLALASWR